MTRACLPLLLAVLLGGCTTMNPPSPAPPPESPRVRCLADPTETAMRPLFFLFCMQSP
jgi:hypothetical protein